MTPTTCGKPSPPRARLPSFPTIPRVHSNTNLTSISTPSAISSNVASASSNSSDASQPATKKPRETTPQSSLSRLSSYGSDKCPQNLGALTPGAPYDPGTSRPPSPLGQDAGSRSHH